MKNKCLSILLLAMCLIGFSAFSQTENEEPLLGLPGDDLDLYAVLNLFQQSKTIEDFEKALNGDKPGIVNLDLNNDGKVDFINVVTEKDGDDFLFILQDPISKNETQDIAIMIVSKDAAGKVSMQIIGDEKLYGKDYVVEPRTEATESVTSNPAYVGDDPVTVNVQATTEVIVVQSAPIVQYVYSPFYAPYYPPYYYGYYPPYWSAVAIISIGVYRHHHYHHHHGYHGGYRGYGHTTVNIHSHNSYNNYNINKRKTSNTVNRNINNGNFKTSGQRGSRPSVSRSRNGSNRATTNRATTNRATTNRATTNRATTNRASKSRSTSRPSASRSMGSRSSSSAGRASRGGGRRR
ncbi:hypothetical protein A9Q87_01500 [Flavobacteriales bacterium 34_180_T64]|nr:hypothetical protein A9Q87_01500 [Flavobacteriales bacterium 34_180_T64]